MLIACRCNCHARSKLATCHARFIISSMDLFILSSSWRDAGICWLLFTVLGRWFSMGFLPVHVRDKWHDPQIIHTWSYLYVVYSLLRPYICTHPGRKIMYLHIMPDICISVCIVGASYGTFDPQLMDRWICKDTFHKRRSTDELYAHSQQVSERCLSHL